MGAIESVGQPSSSVRPEPVEGLADAGSCGSTSSPRTGDSPHFRMHPLAEGANESVVREKADHDPFVLSCEPVEQSKDERA